MPLPDVTLEQLLSHSNKRAFRAAGWLVQDRVGANLHPGRGVAAGEFALNRDHGFADHFLVADGVVKDGTLTLRERPASGICAPKATRKQDDGDGSASSQLCE